jgi:hypothetical protein
MLFREFWRSGTAESAPSYEPIGGHRMRSSLYLQRMSIRGLRFRVFLYSYLNLLICMISTLPAQ